MSPFDRKSSKNMMTMDSSSVDHSETGGGYSSGHSNYGGTDIDSVGSPGAKERVEKEMSKSGIARKEERTVGIVRALVMAAIFFSAIAVSFGVYLFARESDKTSFEIEVSKQTILSDTSHVPPSTCWMKTLRRSSLTICPTVPHRAPSPNSQYHGFVKNIEALVVWEVRYNMALLQQLSGTTTSTALMTDQTFPNVTQPHFEITGGFVDGMGGIMMALSAPLIPASERAAWEEYAWDHQGWIDESARLKVVHPQHRDPLHMTIQDHEHDRVRRRNLQVGMERPPQEEFEEEPKPTIPQRIWRWEGNDTVVIPDEESHNQDRMYAPLWQSSPADVNTVNVDLLSDPRIANLYIAMVKTQQTVMSPGYDIGNLFDWMFDPEEKFRKLEPHAFIMEPMYTNFTNPSNPEDAAKDNAELVGFMIALTSYRNLFTRLLPEGANGLYCVVTDSCGIKMTFELNGPEAVFLGYDDLHEGLEEYESTVPLELYERDADELCVHDLHIYPSKRFQQSYNTRKPM